MVSAFLHTFFIAKILGLWMIIMSFVMLGKRDYFRALVKHFSEEQVAHFMFSSLLTFVGLVLVTFHNYWAWNALLLVTVACWLVLIKGLIWLAFPEWMIRISQKLIDSPWYWVGAVINFIYGVLLLSYADYFVRVSEFISTHPS